ncbi:hypothetical protein DFH09DRAFT_1069138 [Mycena vulgaris]|nr:hypothetical protein DFH09DRAFT_1069138 [Mycena vulgaris]
MAGEKPTRIPGLDAYDDLEDAENAAQALCLVVAAFLDDDLLPLDALYTNAEPCRLVLARHEGLRAILKECHASRNFDLIRNHAALRRQETSDKTAAILEKLRPALLDFLDQEDPLRRWEPNEDQIPDDELRAHVTALKVPAVGEDPCILLQGLGNFSEDPVLDNRVKGIFKKEKHTFVVNASGTGKTRLAFEGLCQNWGFYFTAAVDSSNLGSLDLDRILQTELGYVFRRGPTQDEQSEAARRLLRKLLLSRLLVFHLFVQLASVGGISERHKKLWLIAQLRQRALANSTMGDILHDLLYELRKTSVDYTDDFINHLLKNLRGLFGEGFHIFIVIDEAQVTFSPYQKTLQDAHGPYPILREVIDRWGELFLDHELAVVVVGTDIPKPGFRYSPSASRHRWTSDVGAFDDRAVQREYVLRYLPPVFAASEAGKQFLQRVWKWFHGRHRATDSLMSTLIRDGFQCPHTILDDFVQAVTEHRPLDNEEVTRAENRKRKRAEVWAVPISCAVLGQPSGLTSVLQDTLFHYLLTGRHAGLLGAEFLYVVSTGFGRFVDSEMTQIVVDEPLMIAPAAKWFYSRLSIGDLVPTCFAFLREFPPSSTTLPKVFAMYLARVFAEGYPLYDVFRFPRSRTPSWANQKATLVTLRGTTGENIEGGPSLFAVSLAATPTTLPDIISWLAQEDPTPTAFCLPMGGSPDLICVLKLANGTFIRVILVASLTHAMLERSDLRHMINKMDPRNLFLSEDDDHASTGHKRAIEALGTLPPRPPNVRFPKILRVVASFPAKTQLATATNKSTRAISNLNTGLFKRITEKILVADLFSDMVESIAAGERTRPPVVQPSDVQTRTRSSKRRKTS